MSVWLDICKACGEKGDYDTKAMIKMFDKARDLRSMSSEYEGLDEYGVIMKALDQHMSRIQGEEEEANRKLMEAREF